MVRVAVMVSGGGTNLQAILDAKAAGRIPSAEIALVISNRKDAYALTRAEKAGVKGQWLPKMKAETIEQYGEKLLDVLNDGMNPYLRDIEGRDLELVYRKADGASR